MTWLRADPEDLADLRAALDDLDLLGLEHALEGGVHLVGELVDDVVEADLDALGLRRAARRRVELGVEADDHRVRGGREQDVVVGDVAGALAQDVDAHLVGLDLVQRVDDGAQRALDVGLEDDPQLLGLAGLDLAVQVLERGAAGALGPRRLCARRSSTMPRAVFSSATTRSTSPAAGTSPRPSTTTAVDGPALVTRLPRSSSMARTRP